MKRAILSQRQAAEILGVALAVLALAAGAGAQTTVKVATEDKYARLLINYDLDGEAVSAAKIVALADLADSQIYVVAAQPDVCRLIDATVTDANSSITAGTFTVTGTDCLGYSRSCTFDFGPVATRGSGVKTLTVSGGPTQSTGCYLATVTNVVSIALTGELAGTDKMTVGYSTVAGNGWVMAGALKPEGPNREHAIDPFGSYYSANPLTTTGSVTTSVTGSGAFTDVVAGDILLIPQVDSSGKTVIYERKVVTRISANAATLDKPVYILGTGVPFRYKHVYFSTDPQDGLWIDVEGYKTAKFTWRVDANANTGGVVTLLQGSMGGVDVYTSDWTQISTTTVASAATQANTDESINLQLLPYKYLRFGLKFGTNDDADAAAEDISLQVSLFK